MMNSHMYVNHTHHTINTMAQKSDTLRVRFQNDV